MDRAEGAIITEQGITFAIVLVKEYVLNTSEKDKTKTALEMRMRMPVVLASIDSMGRLKTYGRSDIVKFLSNVPTHAIPWAELKIP